MEHQERTRIPAFWEHPAFWLLMAVLVRLIYLFEQSATSVLFSQQLLDEAELARTARDLLSGAGFGHEPLFKAPLYPVFLAAVMAVTGNAWFFVVRLIQHVLGACLVGMAWDSVRRMLPPGRETRIASVAAAALLTFYGPLIRLEDRLILDFLVVFLQSGLIWALIAMATGSAPGAARKWVLVASVFAMLAWLTRPTITPVLPFIALWIVGVGLLPRHWNSRALRRRLISAAIFVSLPLIAMLAVGARNASVGGEWMILPWQGGYNFYEANRQGASGKFLAQSDFSMAETGNPTRELALRGFQQAIQRGEIEPPEEHFFSAIDSFWMNKAKEDVLDAPGAWLGLMLRKALFLPSEREIFNFESYEIHRNASVILRWMPFDFGVLWPFALASIATLALLARGRRRLMALCWLYGGLLGGAIALYYVSGRLRMPLVFPAVILAAVGLVKSATLVRDHRHRLLAVAYVGLLLVGIGMSWGDWWGVRSESFRYADFTRMSNAAFRAGDAQRALEYADEAEVERPGYPAVPQLRGQALYALGRFDEAADEFEKSMAVMPADPVAPYNLGVIEYYERDDPAKALPLFLEAVKRQPSYHQAAWRAAMASMRLGDWERARTVLMPYLRNEAADPPLLLATALAAWHCHVGAAERAAALQAYVQRASGKSGVEEFRADLERMELSQCLGESPAT